MIEKLRIHFVPALLHALYSIVYFLFILPFDNWVQSVVKLSEQRKDRSLILSEIKSPWPFFAYLKRFVFNFGFDFLIFISYIIGAIVIVVLPFWMTYDMWDYQYLDFGDKAKSILLATLGYALMAYYSPLYISWIRDLCQVIYQFVVYPLYKFLSWCRKPAQHLDLNITKGKVPDIIADNNEPASPENEEPKNDEPEDEGATRIHPAFMEPGAAPVSEPKYYVSIDGTQYGPLTDLQVSDLIREGRVKPNTQVWMQGMADWAPLKKVPELKALL